MSAATRYTLTIDLAVADAAALWGAAASQALAQAGMGIADVVETIGPREAPDLAACLAMLIDPSRFAGCAIDSSEIIATAIPLLPRDLAA